MIDTSDGKTLLIYGSKRARYASIRTGLGGCNFKRVAYSREASA